MGFFPTKGRYDARAVARTVGNAGGDPWPLFSVDSRALSALFKRQPDLESVLAPARRATPPWFGHRKAAAGNALLRGRGLDDVQDSQDRGPGERN